jgi:hypothetical protein
MIRHFAHVVGLPLWLLLLASASPGARELSAQEPFPAWVGLYGEAPLARLENENRLSQVCTDSETLDRCYEEQLAPGVSVTSLYAAPDRGSPVVGELLVVVVPGRGLSAFHRPEGSSGELQFFTPDLYMPDWGYGTYFHQTIADRRGDWFQLPPGPWASPVWFQAQVDAGSDLVIAVRSGDIIEIGGTGWYVVASDRDHLDLRPEQPGDAWCSGGDPPPVGEVQPKRFLRVDLLNARGHLVIRPKYMKGC